MLSHRKLTALVLALGLLVAGLIPSVALPVAAAGPETAPYIIVFNDTVDVDAAVPDVAKAYGLQAGFTYRHALRGMSAVIPAGRLNALSHDPRVKYVVADLERSISEQTIPTGIRRILANENESIAINGADDYRVDVDVAVIDTGIDLQHPDLNVLGGVNCTGGIFWPVCVAGGDDDHYHGTHVAGTIGALDNGIGVVGVAPGTRLWTVKVLNSKGSGYSSWIIAGIDWVAANADTIEVANMSLGGAGYSQAEYDAIQGAVDAGVAFAVAAGNEADDANNYSPSAFDNVLSVSALADFDGIAGGSGSPTCRADQDDTLADFSNWGPEVDVAAPGVCIYSTYPLEQGSYGTISGTSMASPHVAGALALLASADNPNSAADVDALYSTIRATGNDDWTDDSGDGIQEPLLDVSTFAPVLVPVGEPVDEPPTVAISSPADGATFDSGSEISFVGAASDPEDGDLTGGIVWTSDKDGQIGTGGAVSAALSDGTHVVSAAVTDSAGNSVSASVTVVVQAPPTPVPSPTPIPSPTPPPSAGITLDVTTRYVRTLQYADLSWSGASGRNVDVYRGVVRVTTTKNDGAYSDKTGLKGPGSTTYQVCEAGTSTCSEVVGAIWP